MNKAKARYEEYAFAKGWSSVSQVCGIPEKPFLYGWYYKHCKHEKPTAYEITKESQVVGTLIDNAIQHYFDDGNIPELDSKLIQTSGDAKDYYYQSLKNFHSVMEKYKPKSVLGQQVVYSKQHRYIGTFDRLVRINNKLVLIDWKATNYVGYEYKLQLEAYWRALTEMINCGIIKIEGDIKWHKDSLWIVQLPKKEEIDFDKHVIKFEPDIVRFTNGFLGLLNFHYQKQKELGK